MFIWENCNSKDNVLSREPNRTNKYGKKSYRGNSLKKADEEY